MASSSTPLTAFNNQLIAFFEDISETYPEERDLAKATDALKALRRMNPKLLHAKFMELVYPDFHKPVLAEDEVTMMAKAKEVLHGEHSDFSFAWVIFDRHWTGMSDSNKKHIWNYCKAITLLAEKAAGLR